MMRVVLPQFEPPDLLVKKEILHLTQHGGGHGVWNNQAESQKWLPPNTVNNKAMLALL